MPDANGKIRGISIPRVPWHEKREREWIDGDGSHHLRVIYPDGQWNEYVTAPNDEDD